MAHVFRPEYTRSIPPNAERILHKGKPAVRWKGRGGRWCIGIVCADNPKRCRVETPCWYIAHTGPDGKPAKPIKGFTDRVATEAKMAELVKRSARIAVGVLPPEAATEKLTLAEYLDRWRRYITHQGAAETGAARQFQRARDVLDGIEALKAAEITPSAVLAWIDSKKGPNRRSTKTFGAGTAGNYIGAIKSFTRWLCLVERAEPVDHLSALKKRTNKTDVRRMRRALSPEDLELFLATTRSSDEIVYGLTGIERHALYLLACSTGLRAIELSRLTPASFDVKANTVTIEAKEAAKNHRREVLPVPASAMAAVKKLFTKKGGPVWPWRSKQAWYVNGADMVARDLEAAKLPVVDAGRVFDFHSLRGQLATDLDRAGVSLVRAQKLMRHSTPDLTAKHYMKPEAAEMAADVAKLKR